MVNCQSLRVREKQSTKVWVFSVFEGIFKGIFEEKAQKIAG
jgi:hypothetical protein